MSQNEVYLVLKNKRLSGNDKYFNQQQISRMILDGKIVGDMVGSIDQKNIHRDCKRLLNIGILESTKVKGSKCFRIKMKVLEE